MNLTDLERELDAACGGKSLADLNFEKSHQLATATQILRDCHKLLASYCSMAAGGMTQDAWHKKRVELMTRIESVVKP